MNSLVYLLVPLLVAAGVMAVLYWRDRRPTSVNDGIEQFRDGLRALSPESGPRVPQEPRPGPGNYSSYGAPDARSAASTVTETDTATVTEPEVNRAGKAGDASHARHRRSGTPSTEGRGRG